MGRRKKRREQGEVELNVAAMLDMAFQLLTFFILTFKPAPVEGQISLKLPPPQPITAGKMRAGSDTTNTDPAAGVSTLVISVFSDPSGDIASMAVGDGGVSTLANLELRLQAVFADPGNPFEQVVVQVGSNLRYEALMQVIDVCTRQKLPNGEKLSKLSFVEAPGG